jgi:hypothetical protein
LGKATGIFILKPLQEGCRGFAKKGGMMSKHAVAVIALCCTLFGCSPRQSHPPLAQDTGKGKIIVLCARDMIDSNAQVPLFCNNRVVASLSAGTYCEIELLDGQYSLSAGSGDPAQSTVPLKVDVALSAGGVRYFEIVPQGFESAGTMTLKEISGVAATGALSKMKKVDTH